MSRGSRGSRVKKCVSRCHLWLNLPHALCSAAARVAEKISVSDVDVLGVTSVDDELFVLLDRDYDQVVVYSVDDYRLLGHLSLPAVKKHHFGDVASCVRHRCLYMSDYTNSCTHRYDLASGGMGRWSVPGKPRCLSVTPSSNLLVACQLPHKLVELSADSGQCVREMVLQSGIEYPWHAVQLTTGQYVVCHGLWGGIHRVCIVDDDGRVTHSYGDQPGCDVGQQLLGCSCHLAVDEDSRSIFVADQRNGRVVLLTTMLEFVCHVVDELSGAQRLYLDHASRRLYVAPYFGDVVVIQL